MRYCIAPLWRLPAPICKNGLAIKHGLAYPVPKAIEFVNNFEIKIILS